MGQLQLQAELLKIAPNAWYQKPSAHRMTYPCFVYRSLEPDVIRANNHGYLMFPRYEVIYITDTESDEIDRTMLDAFEYCDVGRKYVSDNLYHYVFTIYYQ